MSVELHAAKLREHWTGAVGRKPGDQQRADVKTPGGNPAFTNTQTDRSHCGASGAAVQPHRNAMRRKSNVRLDPHAGVPSAVAAMCLDRLLVPRGALNAQGKPQERVKLKHWMPLIRGACMAAGGALVQVPNTGDGYVWQVHAGRAVYSFNSLRGVCVWAQSRLKNGVIAPGGGAGGQRVGA